MATNRNGAAGVTAREVDRTGVVEQQPQGTPAIVVGTATKGPAFVPVTVANTSQFSSVFGSSDGEKAAPLAAKEWLRSANALTFLRVLGVGSGLRREVGTNAGRVAGAGFVVGEQQPLTSGLLGANPYANVSGTAGRSYVLGALMSESAGSSVFSDAGLQGGTLGGKAVPVMRGFLMAASGVIPKLSSSWVTSSAPSSTLIASNATVSGSIFGDIRLLDGAVPKQEFVLLLNGHKGVDPSYPNVLSASFDVTAPNYFGNVLNTDPTKLQQAGHYLYAKWDLHPSLATITGSVILSASATAGVNNGLELAAFLTSGSLGANVGSPTVPNFENFEDRFGHAVTPWVVSQKFGGVAKSLFRVHSLDDGQGTSYKISIESISPSIDASNPYGTFDLLVRNWNDSDLSPQILQAFRGLSMDPSSDQFIAKKIGDMYTYFDFDKTEKSQRLVTAGSYPSQSPYIRVELDASVDLGELEPTALPFGFRGPAHLVTSGTALVSPTQTQVTASNVLQATVEIPVPYRKTITDGTGVSLSENARYYWGVQFERVSNLSLQNGSNVKEDSLQAFAKYFPSFMTSNANILETGSFGAANSPSFGVLDCDRFNNNGFSLSNVQVVTGSSGLANSLQWKNASYVRTGAITPNDTNKTRALTVEDLVGQNRRFAKFSLFMQGGFDGTNIFDKNESAINDAAVKADMDDANRGGIAGPSVKAYHKGFQVISEKNQTECQILAAPGIRHEVVTDRGIQTVEQRFDALYIFDPEQYDVDNLYVTSNTQRVGVQNTIDNFDSRSLDSTFAATYFPDVVVTDPSTRTNVVVPPTVVVLGAIAYNDKVKHPWFAPAGYARGALASALEASIRLKAEDMDLLSDARINPILSFAGDTPSQGTSPTGGLVIWGQKTLSARPSALDRINVRRLLIEARRQIGLVANTFTFEPNRDATLARFKSAIQPKLDRIKRDRGIDAYLIVVDTSTTTEADVLNNTIRGIVAIKPTNSIENVELTFEVTNKGASVG